MKKIKNIFRYILFPSGAVSILFAVFAAGIIVWRIFHEYTNIWITYSSYFIIVYALILVFARIPSALKMAKTFKDENIYVQKYLTDVNMRVKLVLWYSIAINLVFAAIQITLGILENSSWLIVLGIYYFSLVLIRFILVFEARKNTLGQNIKREYKFCLACGILLCLMEAAVFAIMRYIIAEGKGLSYNYLITASIAVYAFFIVTFTIMNLVRYRNHQSPIILTSEWVNLVEALMCVVFLETSILSLLGEGFTARKNITLISGVAVFGFIFFVSLLIIIGSAKAIIHVKKSKK